MRQVPQHTNRNFRPLTMRHSILPIPSKVEFVTERETFLVYPAVVIPFIFRDDENNVIVIDFVRLVLVSGLVAEDEITGLYVVLKDNRFMIIFSDIFYDFFIHFTCSFLFFSYLYYTLYVITRQPLYKKILRNFLGLAQGISSNHFSFSCRSGIVCPNDSVRFEEVPTFIGIFVDIFPFIADEISERFTVQCCSTILWRWYFIERFESAKSVEVFGIAVFAYFREIRRLDRKSVV